VMILTVSNPACGTAPPETDRLVIYSSTLNRTGLMKSLSPT
jgi:hypothetical protein